MFITLEGPDGGGKTTQATALVRRCEEAGYATLLVHEPGGTDLGLHVRALLVGRTWTAIDPWAEALLFSACRAQLVAEVIRPALERNQIVVADRFSDSTLAYQGAGRGLPVHQLQMLVDIATGGLRPDLSFLLDVPSRLGIERAKRSRKDSRGDVASAAMQLTFFEEVYVTESWNNRFEDEEIAFHKRVRKAYQALADAEPERWVVLDAAARLEEVEESIWIASKDRIAAHPRMTPSA